MRRLPFLLGGLPISVFLSVACRSGGDGGATTDAGVTRTTAAKIEAPDAGFVSAATELGVTPIHAGVARSLAGPITQPGTTIAIPKGAFTTGSTPGDEGRDPALEPILVEVPLNAFSIDALPYPNDATSPPTLVSSAREAAKLCADKGGRLCSELEWERACKGPSGADRYATGDAWNTQCDRQPSGCSSGFGVRAMGFLPEWTDDKIDDAYVIRGGKTNITRRCASRMRSNGKAMPSAMAFRCCHEERNSATMPSIVTAPAFRRTKMDEAELARIFATIPELARIGDGIRLFSDPDVRNSILGRSSASAEGISFATSPLLWSPEPGIELLVATGRSKKMSFIVALYVLPHDRYRFASSFLLLNDVAPVALAYEGSRRKELRWTTCWSCAGEQGGVSIRDDGRVVIVQY